MANDNYDARNPGVAIHTWVKFSEKIKLLDLAEAEGKTLSKFTGEIIEKWLEDNGASEQEGDALT